MRTKNSEKKLNNKGFSLIELIIVIALMIALVAAVFASSSILDSSYGKDAESGIKSYVSMARTKSMSVAAKKWYLKLTKEDKEYVVKLCKVTDSETEPVQEITSVIEERSIGNKVTVKFGTKDSKKVVDASSELKMYFNSSTGKIEKVFMGNEEISMSDGIGYFEITCGTFNLTMKVFYNTGKCERE